MNNARSYGFTLLELMVTVVILTIIAAIAYPAYTGYTIQARRTDAQTALTIMANRLEKYFSTCNSYPTAGPSVSLTNPWPADTTVDCPFPAAGTGGLGQANPPQSPEGHYTLTLDTTLATCGAVAGAVGCFVVTATATTGGLQEGNGDLTIDSEGLKQWNKPGVGWGSWTRK